MTRVSTSPEDTPDTETTPEATDSPDTKGSPVTMDSSDTTGSSSPKASPDLTPTEDSAGEAFVSGSAPPSPGGLFGSETFSVTGLLLLVTVLLGTELIAIFNQYTLTLATDVLNSGVQGQLTGAGLFSALAVGSAAVALLRAAPTTRPWARHLAAATILIGLLLVFLTVASYVLLSG